ncbi:MAG: beta-ketoacyl synthase [Bacteroidia bacterium]|nr:beta-ketoacyl synthase [Bacteroidia bacterium]
MRPVYIASDNICSPLGYTTHDNMDAILSGASALSLTKDDGLAPVPIYVGQIKPDAPDKNLSRFETLAVRSAAAALEQVNIDPSADDVLFILSTTKGNIDAIGERDADLLLHSSARKIAGHFQNSNAPLVVSNACISGVVALIVARRYLERGHYRHAVVVGGDLVSPFVTLGFHSLQALSPERCKPFDKNRRGINLGEAFATLILTTDDGESAYGASVRVRGGGLSNDANHISGPSRTGEELALAVKQALGRSNVQGDEVGFISAHGTATLYNDEMEAKAFNLAGMQHIPLHSLKGYFGHTLGAAGVVESVVGIQSLLRSVLVPTLGYSENGVSQPVNVIKEATHKNMRYCLKTASGFGGCNAALLFEKVD